MSYNVIKLATYIFDLFVIVTFMDGILDKSKRKLPRIPYMVCFITAEVILFITEKITVRFSPTVALFITICVSFISTFFLTFIYESAMTARILASIFFQVFVLLGESIFTLIIQLFKPEILEIGMPQLLVLMNLGSKITLYIFVIMSIIFWKKRIRMHETVGYDILLFMMPLFTFIIIMSMPLKNVVETGNTSFFFLLFTSLSFLNMTNYLLIDKITSANELRSKYQRMEQQVQYQREKYVQLGSYYKSMRSILHDMKNHYFMISSYIENEEYDKLQDYMQSAIQKMESCYAGVNTGNLVIDAFVSNFKIMSENSRIRFHEDISVVPDKIPLTDYELCVIIGNLLDNAYQAASMVRNPEKFIELYISINDSDSFIIYEKNSYDVLAGTASNHADYEHGYGLNNINKIVEKHHGIMQCRALDVYFEITVVIPIIDINKRMQQPIIHSNTKE